MRFRAEQHLRRPSEIRSVREQGQRLDSRAFTLWWKHRDAAATAALTSASSPPTARVCVIASTAAIGNAVRRNRAKRRLREVFRRQQAAVPATCDLLLIARRAVMDSPLPEIEQSFTTTCARIAPAAQANPA